MEFWASFRLLPSAWLLLVQFILLILAMLTFDSLPYRTLTWSLGVLALLLIAKVIRQTPMFTFLGLTFVSGAILSSVLIVLGYSNLYIQLFAHSCEALAYFSAAYGLFRYMFADRYLTRDELFAAAAVFTLIAWGFAFLYNICQLIFPYSFQNPNNPHAFQTWLDLLFLSFSLQSATGLSDLMPITPPARVLAMLQMFCGVMYLALIVTRLIALQYITHLPKKNSDK
ncbi:two pore domain potassium channel family protein [Acinetobacter oleivorans]|nr:two pore domain potassium channel family protein [Acinetobacter oleivorans]MBJ8496492.1 two pore domain potassium channel family protein [Acinetobacter oleivorans]MBJ9421879.1 two pore domain potassium channel family protein [Acinetobacter oleivorans]PTV47786.1 ion channel [Acinetobacter oleivorans]HBU89438.1 ion channel [Acinetobacter sp.]